VVKIGPIASLAIIAVLFAGGIIASLWADKRDPDSEAKRRERGQRTDPGSEQAEPEADPVHSG